MGVGAETRDGLAKLLRVQCKKILTVDAVQVKMNKKQKIYVSPRW
jgi:hypothetical protein